MKMKLILLVAALLITSSKLGYSASIEAGESVAIDNNGNPQLNEREALKNTVSGELVENRGEILIEGTHPSNNSNLAGIRVDGADVINSGTIKLTTYDAGQGINAKNSTVENSGRIEISGGSTRGIVATDSEISNSGEVDIIEGSRMATGIEVFGGSSTNSGTISVGGSMSNGMSAWEGAVQENKGEITVTGDQSVAMISQGNSTSLNTGKITSEAYQGRGIISYEGSHLENSGEIVMGGYQNFGMVSDNKSGAPSTNNVVNNGEIRMTGDISVAMAGMGINEIQNNGTIYIEGSGGVGIKYSNVNDVKNDGEIILKGTANWAFGVDIVKDTEVKSVGNISIIDSTSSGAIKVEGSVEKGINEAEVSVKNGSGIAVIKVDNTGEAINRGIIDIEGGKNNYGIHSKDGKKVSNENLISIGGTQSAAIYSPGGEFIQNTGTIELKGDTQTGIYYENEDAGLVNTGEIIITGNNGTAFDVNSEKNTSVRSVGNVTIAEGASNSSAAYAKYSIKTATNEGSIKVHGKKSSGLTGLDGTTLENKGTIFVDTNESYGIYAVNDATVINEGHISNIAEDGIAIFMGVEDSNLYMDTNSTITGSVYSAGGVATFYGTNTNDSLAVHDINYDLVNFSHLDLKEGSFNVGNDTLLIAPKSNVLASDHFDTSEYSGSLVISEGAEVTMQVGVNEGLSSTIHAETMSIEGKLNYMPIDQVYVTEEDEIIITNIFTEEEITGVSDETVDVINVVEGWSGDYLLSEDNTNLSLVLTRSSEGKYLPDSYYDGVFNYPHTYLDVKNVNEAAQITRTFGVIDKIHNEEIPYMFEVTAIGGAGNYDGGDGKGKFNYRRYGNEVKFYNKITDDILYEGGFSYIESNIKYRHLSKEKMQSYTLTSSLAREFDDGFKLGGYISASLNKHDLERGVTGKKIILNTDYDTFTGKVGTALGHEYRVDKNTLYTSYLDVGVLYQYTEDYTERGDTNYAMHISENETFTPVLSLGVDRTVRDKNIRTNIGAKLNYYMGDPMERRESYFLFKPEVRYDVEPVNMPEVTVAFNMGAEIDLSTRVSVFLNGKIEAGKDLWEALGRIGVTYEF
ncbi:hypothetical protein PM10SUCC1_29190 [Propionigenium maris DSM 9537]|uniref:Autotransporter domain-containing protein n=1 Tax=Propionigenium maris DSM 9537 TaxID=1123000 RepID=A0A9W6GNW1_9FUSO|nr:autotransporter outer membrane beta-barrel domain-containing protein [Propionigenium maris]GLI57405.1 hypothetical protein PM10SUCC1_29190 [Propionigenium maris DSM 9537]